MLKGTATAADGTKIVLVGLSRRNLEILMNEMLDTHIKVSGKQMGVPFDILIFSGETEEVMAHLLKSGDTKIFAHQDENET